LAKLFSKKEEKSLFYIRTSQKKEVFLCLFLI
jgi:hypothetical protein